MKQCYRPGCENQTLTKFCSQTCSAIFNNIINPKRQKTAYNPCKYCNQLVYKKQFCNKDYKTKYYEEKRKYCIKCNCILDDNNRVKNQNRCKDCYNKYQKEYLKNRYKTRRSEIIQKLGGECIDCGSTENLELDHNDYTKKEFDVAKIWGYQKEKLDKELEKCVLRCYSCHKIKTSKDFEKMNITVEHGGGLTGKRDCRCELCLKKRSSYNRVKYQEYKKIR